VQRALHPLHFLAPSTANIKATDIGEVEDEWDIVLRRQIPERRKI
jgi:hypothetical protein